MIVKNDGIAALIIIFPIFITSAGLTSGLKTDEDSVGYGTFLVRMSDKGYLLHGDTSVPDEELLKQYGDKVPERPIINSFAKKLGGSFFPHKEHVDAKRARCGNCHHKEPRDIKNCWDCHPDKPEDPEAPKYLKAYHDLCLECHKAIKAERGAGPEDKPPTKKCYDCHFKKSEAPPKEQVEEPKPPE